MLNKFPIQYYCESLVSFFGFELKLNDRFYLTILSQFFSNPRYRINKDQQQENQPLSIIKEIKQQPTVENKQGIQQIQIGQQSQQNTRYFIAQIELNPTGLISNQFFIERYLLQGKQGFKTPINEVQLNNTFFISSSSDESERQSQQKSSTSDQQIELLVQQQVEISDEQKSQKQNKKSNEKQSKKNSKQSREKVNQLSTQLDELVNLFRAAKLSQQTDCNTMIQQHRQFNSFEQITDEIKYMFISKIIKSISQVNLEEKCVQLGFQTFYDQLFQLISQKWGRFKKQFQDQLFKNGIIFNSQLNRQLIIRDYQFFCKNFSLLETQSERINQSLDYNELIIKLICENIEFQQYTVIKLQEQNHQMIESCKEFQERIKEQIQINQLNDWCRYHLLIVSIQKINEKCIQQIATMLNSDEEYKKFNISYQFISLNLQNRKQVENNTKLKENNKEVSCEIYNPLMEKEFLQRYKIGKKVEVLSYSDTQEVMCLNFYKCNAHLGQPQAQI